MKEKKIWKKISAFEGPLESVYQTDSFHQIIEHEIQRSQRTENDFSFIIFNLSNIGRKKASFFIETIKKSVRTIDYIGWVDNTRLGIILPYTEEEGARQLAVKIRRNDPDNIIPFVIYHYPDHWYGTHEDLVDKNCEASHESLLKLEETIENNPLPLWKRTIDIIGAGTGLLLLSPLFLTIGAYIKLVSPGKVFYVSKRVGYRGKEFNFIKFRSMHENNNQGTHASYAREFIQGNKVMEKLDDSGDVRIIPLGKYLRLSCIDELPQLINVLKGDMSLVGPRPCIPYEAEVYKKWHKMRLNSMPGMTGLWQVSGKNKLTFFEMIRLDIQYIENLSFWNDVKILLKTIPAIMEMISESGDKKQPEEVPAITVQDSIEKKLSFS